ncbi:hypothetical protein Ddye_026158 [Dipteronia dyeriana]|uniref:Uncharacterized protein n=1 Tax=Dipteronia dyeriana TaxID=168575 RepID=A0AAD9TMH4_9ROSI|nr:hypothetical protein Ddye_026158 [Dipteronia dyeriana]
MSDKNEETAAHVAIGVQRPKPCSIPERLLESAEVQTLDRDLTLAVEDILYEVEIVEGIKDESWILEAENYDPTVDIDCSLNVVEVELEAKSIFIDKVSKIFFLHLDFKDPTLFLLSEVYSFKPVIDKIVHLKYYPPKQSIVKLEDDFFVRGREYYVGFEELATRNHCPPSLRRRLVTQAATNRHRQWRIAWASSAF